MSSSNLNNLVKVGQLKLESYDQAEFLGLVKSGKTRLKDADNKSLSLESRFDLAYNSAHALSLAALRYNGHRANTRYIVFQSLPYTLGVGPEIWRVLSKCHDLRNLAEYEGSMDIEEKLLKELLSVTHVLLDSIEDLKAKSS